MATLGLGWIWACFAPVVFGIVSGERDAFSFIFLFTIVPMMAIPGLLAVIFGCRLFREMSESTIKGVVGIWGVLLAVFISSFFFGILPKVLPIPEELIVSVAYFFSSLVAILSYLAVVRFLLRKLKGLDRSFAFYLNRGIFLVLAWQIWSILFTCLYEYTFPEEYYERVNQESWDILRLLVPTTVAYFFYRLSVHFFIKAPETVKEHPLKSLSSGKIRFFI